MNHPEYDCCRRELCWRDSYGTEFHPGSIHGVYIVYPTGDTYFIGDGIANLEKQNRVLTFEQRLERLERMVIGDGK